MAMKDTWSKGKIEYVWRMSGIVPIHKQKGNVMGCGSYRGIKLMEHAMKVSEQVVDKKLREIGDVDGVKFGFMK